MSKKDKILKDIENGILVYPYKWHDFCVFLKSKIPKDQEVPVPLILGGSGASSYEKNQRLIEHINIARKNDVLDVCLNFLLKLPEEEWGKSDGNLDPNEMSYWDIIAEDDKKLRLVNIKALPYLKKLKNINSKINDYEVLSKEINDKIIIRYYPNYIYLISDESEYNKCLIKLHEIFLEQKTLNNSKDDIEDFCYDILDLQIESRKENSNN